MIIAYDESFEKYNIEDGHVEFEEEADDSMMEEVEKEENVTFYKDFYKEAASVLKKDNSQGTMRVFKTREEVNKDVIVRFERLLDEYFDSDAPLQEGLPTVKYFADKVFLSANYFGDMIKKQTGQTASEYIQKKLIERAKETLLGTDKTTSEIAYELGFQYPQHLSRMFKRMTGCTPNEFRSLN